MMVWHGQVVCAAQDQDLSRGNWIHKAETALKHIHWFRKDPEGGMERRPSPEDHAMEAIQYNTSSSEYAQAMRSIRKAKFLFLSVTTLSILVQLAAFVMVHGFNVPRHTLSTAAEVALSPTPASGPTPHVANWLDLASWSNLLHWLLPLTMFLGAVSSMLLCLTVLFGVKIALLGRRPGLATMISCFFWSLILLAFMIPWQQVMGVGSGATFVLADLEWWKSWIDKAPLADHLIFYARFPGFLAAAFIVAVIVHIKFAIASRAISGIATISLVPDKPGNP